MEVTPPINIIVKELKLTIPLLYRFYSIRQEFFGFFLKVQIILRFERYLLLYERTNTKTTQRR